MRTRPFPRARRSTWGAALVSAVLVAAGLGPPAASADTPSTLRRPQDPVVLTGADVPSLIGRAPGDVVAFRYAGGWVQVPVQVDERALVDLGTVYDTDPIGVVVLTYTDPGTFTGPDPDPALDANDEIAFMAKDAGARPGAFSEPAGVVPGTGLEIAVSDPLSPGSTGFVYLFRQGGSLQPGAGRRYVTYRFHLRSGNYKTTYDLASGPNPEDSTIRTAFYVHHFADRWIDDEVHVKAGAATEVDILDRHKNQFRPGDCSRTENTFSAGEGAFVVNKSGPVRAIRSYLGAKSGPLTQREHLFYQRRQDITTFLRVHDIPGVMDYFDYSAAAVGMRYANDLNQGGVTIDGEPDAVATGPITWEMVNGHQGALVMAASISTNIPGFAFTSYYLDQENPTAPSEKQCTGDRSAYGSSGVFVDQSIPSTDPALGSSNYLNGLRVVYYEPPGLTVATAKRRQAQSANPLQAVVAPWAP